MLNEGKNVIELSTIGNVFLNEGISIGMQDIWSGLWLDCMLVKKATVYEAENAVLTGGTTVSNEHNGYTGAGFITGYEKKEAAAKFNLDVPASGNFAVKLKYANGYSSGDGIRTLSLYINGKKIKQINLYLSQYSIHEIQDPTKASIILPAGTGGIFVHEAIGHCLEADQYFKKDAVLNGYLGKTITNNKAITISDSCCSTDMIKYKVSDDGSIPRSLTLVKDGCLENIMTDAYSSSIYGIADSGNGRSANYYSFPIPRMRNTYIHNGTDKVEDIIKSTKYGLIPIDIQGGNVTVETGNFVFNISHALIIQSGEIVGISKPFLFSGNIINAIDSIERIGNDLKFCRDVCGKRGQLIDVAYGTPTILLSQRTHYE
jgi:hypothetical protein